MIENVPDVFSIYTTYFGLDPDTVWHKPFYQVREIAQNNAKIKAWIQS